VVFSCLSNAAVKLQTPRIETQLQIGGATLRLSKTSCAITTAIISTGSTTLPGQVSPGWYDYDGLRDWKRGVTHNVLVPNATRLLDSPTIYIEDLHALVYADYSQYPDDAMPPPHESWTTRSRRNGLLPLASPVPDGPHFDEVAAALPADDEIYSDCDVCLSDVDEIYSDCDVCLSDVDEEDSDAVVIEALPN
jgi:hypothetical protein